MIQITMRNGKLLELKGAENRKLHIGISAVTLKTGTECLLIPYSNINSIQFDEWDAVFPKGNPRCQQ